MRKQHRILLTGATGYVGGMLLKRLELEGHTIQCLVRNPDKLTKTGPNTTLFRGDVLDRSSIDEAFQGVDTGYYLIHSLGDKHDFEAHEIEAAMNFAAAARSAGVKRIIYLGGLGNAQEGLSPHLKSRQYVGHVLRGSGIPTMELRASIVLGAGSLSFEMIRALTEHLPFMVMPKWVSVKAQPIGIRDLLDYLVQSMEIPLDESNVVEIGGADQVSYRDLMVEYARQRGLKRLMIPIPLLTPWLSSHWLGLVTPLYATVGRKLIASICNSTVVENQAYKKLFEINPCGMREAIAQALESERLEFVQPGWLDGFADRMEMDGHCVFHDKNRLVDYRRSLAPQAPHILYRVISSIGGPKGMFSWNSLWRVREWLDQLCGGGGLRHKRNEGQSLSVGDDVDFFKTEIVEQDRRIRLRTEMKLPGTGWLEFMLEPTQEGTLFHQAVIYEPKGFSGRVYWYATYPFHALIFNAMHGAMLQEARQLERNEAADLMTVPY